MGISVPFLNRYASTRSGMASELVEFKSKNVDFTVSRNAPFNILRPETVESLYVLHQLTGDNVYREWGWQIFRAIEEFCKTEAGYGSLLDVNDPDLGVEDRMESFFLAETLKYLYLLQDPESSLDIINKVSLFYLTELFFLHISTICVKDIISLVILLRLACIKYRSTSHSDV